MNVLICGGGKVGRQLASVFRDAGHTVTVVEARSERVEAIRALGEGVTCISGDATDPGVLADANAVNTDVLVAATGSDEANMLSCFLARTWFNIPKTIARVNDPRNEHMFTPEYGCDVAISYSSIIAKMVIEETSFADVVTLLKLRRGTLTLVEGEVRESSELAGKTLASAALPREIVVVAVLRGDETLLARGHTKIMPGDRLVALNSQGSEEVFRDLLR